jgi:hypothetical protein
MSLYLSLDIIRRHAETRCRVTELTDLRHVLDLELRFLQELENPGTHLKKMSSLW